MEIIAETANLRIVGALFGQMFATLGSSESIGCSIISFFVFDRWIIVVTESIGCSKEIFHRVQNLESPIPSAISGSSQEGIRKEKVPSIKNSLRTLAGDRTFCLLTSAKCIYAILASSNCGMSTRGFFAAWKIASGAIGCKSIRELRMEVWPKSQAFAGTNCWASLSPRT